MSDIVIICPSCENGQAGNPYVTCETCEGYGKVIGNYDLKAIIERMIDRRLSEMMESAVQAMAENG